MNKVPQIRFRGFEGEWEEKKIGDVGKINPKTHDLPDEFYYVDLTSVLGTRLIDFKRIKKIKAPSRAQRLAVKGDIFYQTVRPYQKNNYLFSKDNNDFVFSTGYAQIRPSISSEFLFGLIQTKKFVNSVNIRTTGTSFPAIAPNDLSKILISFPSCREQEKIGKFFQNLDALIETQEQVVENSKAFKQSMLQKMFPKKGETVPEIRFAGFEGDWEETTFDQIGKVKSAGVDKKIYKDQDEVYLLNYMDVYNNNSPNLMNLSSFMKTTATNKEILEKNVLAGDIFFTPSSETPDDIGHSMVIENSFQNLVYSYHLMRFRPYKGILDIHFSNYFANIMPVRKQLIISCQGVQRYTLKISDLEQLIVFIPSLPEQEKIGFFFRNLDETIQREEELLATYQSLKQSFLQKMFV